MKSTRNILFFIIFTISLSLILFVYFSNQIVKSKNVNVYFVKSVNAVQAKLYPVLRPLGEDDFRMEKAINELLSGPNPSEKKDGLYSEIPEKTRLIGIKETKKNIEINLSEEFVSQSGSESTQLRLKQLTRTVLDLNFKKPVYLNIEGKRVKYIGGEGVEVPQPLKKL